MTSFERWSIVVDVAQTISIVLGFVLAYRQLRLLQKDAFNSVELSERQNAMILIARYSDPAFVESRLRLHSSTDLDLLAWQYLLNFFEELAIAVKHKTANPELLRDFFGTILRDWMENERTIAAVVEARRQHREIFSNALELYRDWESGRAEMLRIDQIPSLK